MEHHGFCWLLLSNLHNCFNKLKLHHFFPVLHSGSNHSPQFSNAEPVEIATRIFTLDMNDYRVVGNPSVDTENALSSPLLWVKGLLESKNRNGEKQPLCKLDTFLDPETETSISEFINWLFSNWMIPNQFNSYLRLLFD